MQLSTIQAQQKNDIVPTIIGGNEVNPPFKYPLMTAVYFNNTFTCGGTLYKENVVITAAHCTQGQSNLYTVKLHRHNLEKFDYEEGGKTYQVTNVINHPSYDDNVGDNDISLLKLNLYRKDNKLLINLDDGRYGDNTGHMNKAIGWGTNIEGGGGPPILQEVDVPIYDIEKCKKNYAAVNDTIDSSTVFCAGYDKGGKDTCQGDSGGPLAVFKYEKMTLVGVTSGGEGCARPKLPGIYTRISAYLDWIINNSN